MLKICPKKPEKILDRLKLGQSKINFKGNLDGNEDYLAPNFFFFTNSD